jgi:hypothetical protein
MRIYELFFSGLSGLRLGLLLLLLSPSEASIYYVDYTSGSDANLGTSTSGPFKHCPGDVAASGKAASTILAPGDTVLFKGGVEYILTSGSGNVRLNWNGSMGNPITYDGNSNGNWGTGRAVITSHYNAALSDATAFAASSSKSFLTFKNFQIWKIGGSSALPKDNGSPVPPLSGNGIDFGAGITGGLNSVIVQDCVFSELGYYWNAKPMDQASIEGEGIFAAGINGLTITNCDFSKMNIACEMQARPVMTNLVIANCSFHDSIRWCIDLPVLQTGASLGGVDIKDSYFYNYHQFDSPQWAGYGEWPHTDGIFLRADYSGCKWGNNINFYRNLFYNNAVDTSGGTACIYITEGPSANVFDNVFINAQKGRTLFLYNGPMNGASPQVVTVYNNTFFDSWRNQIDIEDGGTPVGSVTIRNNVLYDDYKGTGNVILYLNTTKLAGVNFDYNLYYTKNTLGQFVTGDLSGGLSAMRAQGWETHGIVADPKWVDISYGLGSNCNLNNLSLQATSPARDSGSDLSGNSFPVQVDLDKHQHGTDGHWDMGAYEFQTVTDTTAPRISSIVPTVKNSQSVLITWTTDENADSRVDYGVTVAYGSNAVDGTYVTAHAITLSNLNQGTLYHFRVMSRDSSANLGSSADLTFSTKVADTVAPTITITSPSAGSVLSNVVSITANALDNSGGSGVSNVIFLLDGTVLNNSAAAPYAFSFDTRSTQNGSHIISAQAWDFEGNRGDAPSISVIIQNQGPTLGTGLLGYWDFDHGSATQVTDQSGNAGTATLVNGATLGLGKLGNGLTLGGGTSFATVGDSAALRVGGDITISLWVQHGSLPLTGAYMYYLEKGENDKDNYALGCYGAAQGPSLFFEFTDSSNNYNYVQQSSGPVLSNGQWTHIAFVFDHANGALRFYSNGQLLSTATSVKSLNETITSSLSIGHQNIAGYEFPMNGSLDELRIYNRALSAADVQILYNARPPHSPGNVEVE